MNAITSTSTRPAQAGLFVPGLCECGCGRATATAEKTRSERGIVKGQPYRFIRGHHMRGKRGAEHPRWREGGKHKGYLWVQTSDGWVQEHRHVMGLHLGRPLRATEVVHHINRDQADNRPENLQVMTAGEHARLHLEERGR